MSSIPRIESDVCKARDDVRADFEALGRELGRDERQIGQAMRQYAPMLVAGAGALGILIGLAGLKVIKALVIAGTAGAVTYTLLRHAH